MFLFPNNRQSTDQGNRRSRDHGIKIPGKQYFKGSWGQENMAPGNQEATSPRFQQGLISRFQNFLKSGHQELLRSGVLDLWSSWVQELMISGHQGLLTSGYQDAKTSIRIDFLTSLFHDGLSSRFIHSVSRLFCSRCRLRERAVRLFRLAGEQAETGRDVRPVFGGQKHYMFWPRQAVFSVTRNRFRNRKQLARKGMENSSEVVVFYRAPRVPRSDFNHRRVFDTLRSKMDTMQGIIASYGQKKRSIYRQNRPFNWPWSVLYSTEFLLTRTIFWKRLKSIFHKKRSRCVKSVICD